MAKESLKNGLQLQQRQTSEFHNTRVKT